MSHEDSPTLPSHYRLIRGPFPLLQQHNLYWVSLVDTAKAGKPMEAGICLDGIHERVFCYPEEALSLLAILRKLEPQLSDLLQRQGMYTQQNRDVVNDVPGK